MSFSIKRLIFAHDFLNPPTEDRSCDIDIMITDPSGKITLTKEAPGLQTRFILTVAEPSLIYIADSGQAIVEKGIKDLLLSFNLGLVRTCLSTLGGGLYSAEVEMKPTEAKITIEETPAGKNIKISETLAFRETLHITIGTREEISEQQAMVYLNKITGVSRFSSKPRTARESNLSKALNEYEMAMSSFDRLRTFKSLFNTVEFCANWTGTDYQGRVLDANIAATTRVSQQDVEFWRSLYNRTKHVDKSALEALTFIEGTGKLPEILPKIREVAKQLIINCLSQI